MEDIEQRAQNLLNQLKAKRHAELADKVFREPERKKAKEQAKKEAAERERKEIMDRWGDRLAKAQEHMEQKQAEQEQLIND